MQRRLSFSIAAAFFAVTGSGLGSPLSPDMPPDLGRHFRAAGVTGTFVMFDPARDQTLVYNPGRARERFLPASTFKIANALLALDAGVVRDLEEVVPYGGGEEYFDSWEKDMDLVEAMRVSNVAVFHEVAKRVTLERFETELREFGYGNADPGASIDDRFWLAGPLAISALEQVEFLDKLASGNLPVSGRAVELVKETILQEETDSYKLYAKTGWAGPARPMVGWWVGWVQRGESHFPFALNILIEDDSDAPKRISVAKACLRDLGLLPEEDAGDGG